MKRTLVLLSLLAILGSGYYFFTTLEDDKIEAIKAERDFAVDKELIKKVVFTTKDGKSQTVTEKDGIWYIDGKRMSKNQSFLFVEALSSVRMQSIPPKGAYNQIMKTIGRIGILVRVFGENDELLKSYYVGGVPQDERGTYYLMEGSGQPYLLNIPGMEGSTRGRFIKRPDDWLDRAMFRYPNKDIQKITVEYPRSKNDSYTLEKNGNSYDVTPFFNFTPRKKADVNQRVVEDYLENYHIGFFTEAYVNDHPLRDSIVTNMVPFSKIRITNEAGDVKSLDLYPLNEVFNMQGEAIGPNVDKYIERYYVNVDGGERFMLTQQILAKKFLWGYDFFFRS